MLKLAALALSGVFAVALVACGTQDTGPLIQTVGPATIIPGRSSLVLISGQGFKDGAAVTFGGQVKATKSVWVNAGYITAVLPDDIRPAQYSVEVTNPDGQRAVSRTRVTVSLAPTATVIATPERKATIYPPTPRPTPSPTATPTETPTPLPTPVATPTPVLEPPRVIIVTPTARPPVIIPPNNQPQSGPPQGAPPPSNDLPRPSDPFHR